MDFDTTHQHNNQQLEPIPEKKKSPKTKKTGLIILLVLCRI